MVIILFVLTVATLTGLSHLVAGLKWHSTDI